jgi:hypothetical protein
MKFSTLLAFVFSVLMVQVLPAQNLGLASNPDAGLGMQGNPIVYGSYLYYNYKNASSKNQLAKYDGASTSLVANPDAGTGFNVNISPIVFNGNLYFSYLNASNTYQLAKYDGTLITLITNPDGASGFSGSVSPLVYNGNLYFQYLNTSNNYQLAKYDGSSVTLVANPDGGFGFISDAIVYGSNLYFRYYVNASLQKLAKYDGTSVTLVANPDGGLGVSGNSVVYSGNLYFGYVNTDGVTQMAKYDGTALTLVANPDQGNGNFSSSIEYGGNLYFRYFSEIGKYQLAKYNGTSITLVSNPDLGQGVQASPIVYGSNLYYRYLNASSINQLVKYDGSSETLVNNPDIGNGFQDNPFVFGSNLYFRYRNASTKNVLAKYDGTTVTLIGNPDAGNVQSGSPVVYSSNLYCRYLNASSIYQLAGIKTELSGLSTAVSLSPGFSSSTLSYTMNLSSASSSTTVTPTAADGTAIIEVRVNGGSYATVASGSPSAALPLNFGNNTIDIRVTVPAHSAIPNTYTINANRAGIVVTGANTGNGSYNTFGAAFTAIGTVQTGANIVIDIACSVTEPSTAILDAGDWASLSIKPSGGSQTIDGNINGPLIFLSGADNVTIDGLNTGGNALTISNTATGASSAIQFVADASNNTIQNCTIQGSASVASYGVVLFGTGTTTGNDNNNINNCNITAAGANLPINGVYSQGTDATIANSGNTLNANNISDYHINSATSSKGINLSATGNSTWTISNNKLFQTATRSSSVAQTMNAIFVGSGSGYSITGNTIGFANAAGTGTTNITGNSVNLTGFPGAYTASGTPNATRYIAINCAFTAGGAVSSIQNNTIAGFALYTSSGASTNNGIFCGINVTAGNANIGTVTGNAIGAATGQGSIYTACSTSGGTVVGIYATSANTVNISNNTIWAIDASGTTVTTSGGFTGIDAAGTGAITISNNTIGNSTADNIRTGLMRSGSNLSNAGTLISTTGATAAMVGIRNAATGASSITGNTIRGLNIGGTVTACTGITVTGAVTTSNAIIGNMLGTAATGWVRYAFANSSILTGINASATAAAATVTISSNDFRGIVYSTAGTGAHTYITWNHASSTTDNINSNTFTNLDVNTSGSIIFLNRAGNMTATGVENVNSNAIVTAFNKGASGGGIYFFNANGASVQGSAMTNNGNNFSNVTVSGATSIAGWVNANGLSAASGPTKTITNNTFNNITANATPLGAIFVLTVNGNGPSSSVSSNTITNITGGAAITGVSLGLTNQSTTVSQNQIGAITTSGNAAAIGISNASIAMSITKNKLYGISATGAGASAVVSGIAVTNTTASSTVTLSNNLIGNLTAPASTSTNGVMGIDINGTATTSIFNVYYNTIYLNNTSSGAGFGSSGISTSASSTATTSTLNLRNNIIVNTSVQNGAGLTVAYRRSAGAAGSLANYASTSNNNLFYAGTPSAINLIYSDGTSSAQTLSDYKNGVFTAGTIAPRDAASITEAPSFLSTVGSNASFLHINIAVATAINNAAATIAGITDDYDGDTRDASTPDIGADEIFASTNANLLALSISAGTLSPSFAAATIAYTDSVSHAVTSVTVTPTVADATATIQVKVNGGGFTSVTSGSPSSALSLNVGSNTIEVKVTAQDGTTIKTYTITVTRGTATWTGTTSAAWNTASNWNTNAVPDPADDVVIPAGTLNSPSIPGTSSIFINGLTINSGATLTNAGTAVFLMDGNFTNNGTLTTGIAGGFATDLAGNLVNNGFIGGANIALQGFVPQTISGTGTIENLATANSGGGVTITSGTTTVTSILSLRSGNLAADGHLVLASNALGTASVAEIDGSLNTGTISGNVTQERYIPAKAARTYSFVASPFTQSISSAWQQQVYITGAGTGGTVCPTLTAHSNGFDATVTNAASLFVYDGTKAVGSRWTSVTGTTAVSLAPGIGYRMNIRGPRSTGCSLLDGTVNTVAAVTMRSTGTLGNADKNMGSFSIGLLNNGNATVVNDNYLLTGNPYPSQVSFAALLAANNGASGINNGYAVYAPGNTVGNYAFWDGTTWTGGNTGLSDATGDIIANGQAFFVQGKLAGAGINLNWAEAMKTVAANNGYFRTQLNPNRLRIGYMLANGNKADEIMLQFRNNASSNEMNSGDIVSINTGTQHLKSLKAGRELAFNTRNLDFVNDTVMLHVASSSNGQFKLSFYDFDEFVAGTNARIYLVDKYTGTTQLMNDKKDYPFTVTTNDAASFGASRFVVVFNKPVLVTVPVAINVKAYPNPVTEQLTVELPTLSTGSYTVKLTDLLGRVVMLQQAQATVVLRTSKLPHGTYLLEVSNANGDKFIEKIIK